VIAGGDTELGMAVDQLGGIGGNGDVSKDRHHQPGTHRDAVDRRHHRLAAIDHVVDHVARFLPNAHAGVEIRHHLADELEVAAGRERLAGAGEQDRIHTRIGVDHPPDFGEVAVHLAVGGIELVWPVHHHAQDPGMRPIDLEPRKACVRFIHL